MREPAITRRSETAEVFTRERCYIEELWNDDRDEAISLARARVTPGVVTERHRLDVDERYLVCAGEGLVEVEGLPPRTVRSGDVVLIPALRAQRIANTGAEDLVFLCICTPRFRPAGYREVTD